MTSRILVGLSGPTFFDYQNAAARASNDLNSSPNPILENALGLTLFYDEIWFLCESLCPQSLRGHPKIQYLDRHLQRQDMAQNADLVRAALSSSGDSESQEVADACRENFDNYWEKAQRAGAYWWDDAGRAIDNHTHALSILGSVTGGNSNRLSTLEADIGISKALKGSMDVNVSLNSFTRNIFNAIYPTQHHPVVQAGDDTILGSAVINALVPNCVLPQGPHPDIFDRVSSSSHAGQFRGYIKAKNINDAYACYTEIVHEIEQSIVDTVKKSANSVHPTRGITMILIESAHELLGTGLLSKIGRWYGGQVSPPPVAAAAFVLDVKGGI